MFTSNLKSAIRGTNIRMRGDFLSPNGSLLISCCLITVIAILAACKATDSRSEQAQACLSNESVSSITLSPDGEYLAVSSCLGLHLIQADTFHEMWFMPLEGGVSRAVFSPDASRLISLSSGKKLTEWESKHGKHLRTWGMSAWDEHMESYASSLAWSPNGSLLVVGRALDIAIVWEADTGEQLYALGWDLGSSIFSTGPSRLWRVAWSSNGVMLAYGLYDNRVSVWDIETRELLHLLEGHTDPAFSLAFSPDDSKLASMSWREIIVWDGDTGEQLMVLEGKAGGGGGLTWSPDGEQLASGFYDGSINVWSAETGELLYTLEGSSKAVHTVVFSLDGETLFAGAWDGFVAAWSTETGERLHELHID